MPDHARQALRLVAAGITSIEEVNRVLAAEPITRPARPDSRRDAGRGRRPITRMLVKLLLERDGYEVLEATNGRERSRSPRRERPDLLIIDLNMPEMDGYEAIAHSAATCRSRRCRSWC